MSAREAVVATGNEGKLREIRRILDDLACDWHSLAAFPDVVLPAEGLDYAANAIAKAVTAARETGRVAVADDSGLEVDGLDGRPGPLSARYGGEGLSAAERVDALLAEMAPLSGASRRARFVCFAAVATPGGDAALAEGSCAGSILAAPRGDGGFGYDPVFLSAELGVAMAELDDDAKNRISHRARAFRALRAEIEKRILGAR